MQVLRVRTGCRLHFGLMELAHHEPLRFAGLGLMLSEPGFELTFSSHTTASITHPLALLGASIETPTIGERCQHDATEIDSGLDAEFDRRVEAVVQQRQALDDVYSLKNEIPCQVRITSSLPLHSGLGAGTQLAASVATGLELFSRASANSQLHPIDPQVWQRVEVVQPPMSPQWLSLSAARGLRSAVGLIGFLRGGMILDRGYLTQYEPTVTGNSTATRPVDAQTVYVASAWQVVLIVPQPRAEVSGAKEAAVMEELGAHPNPNREHMLALGQRAMALAMHGQSFADFTNCLGQYMELGSQLFSRHQGGMYNGADVTEAVRCAREIGLRGVGQSSWGPTVFGFAEDKLAALRCAERLTRLRPEWSVRVSTPAPHGAVYCWQEQVDR